MAEQVPRGALRRLQEAGRLADLSRLRPRAAAHRARRRDGVPRSPQARLRAEQLEDFDALILLAHRFDAESVPKSGRLAAVARFGVGYDTVDVEACTQAGIALVITPDGVRRPVAVSVLTLMLALTGKLMVKDRLTREAAAGYAKRSDHMGVGLVGRTLGSLGIGNIGAEVFRLAAPFDMSFIAHDPFADTARRGRARRRARRARGALPPRRRARRSAAR